MDPQTEANPFPVTQWSLVLKSRADDSTVRARALEELCTRYWPPLYAYARRMGHSAADSEDLTQGFLSLMLSREDFGRAEKNRGKFRAYIRTAFRNFVADFHKAAKARKRGGDAVIFSIDKAVGENLYREFGDDELSPEKAFDRHFAVALLDRALSRLRAIFEQGGKLDQFATMQPFLDHGLRPSYSEISGALNLSESAAKSAIHRFRGQYRKVVLEEVADTLGENGNSEEELQYLLSLFG